MALSNISHYYRHRCCCYLAWNKYTQELAKPFFLYQAGHQSHLGTFKKIFVSGLYPQRSQLNSFGVGPWYGYFTKSPQVILHVARKRRPTVEGALGAWAQMCYCLCLNPTQPINRCMNLVKFLTSHVKLG